jgi:glycosyltransferase involved in cell wall biosynthesis
MNFIIHTQYYPPETGAPQARLSEFAEGLVQDGHNVTILTAIPNYPIGRIYPGYKAAFCREVIRAVPVIRSWIYPSKSIRLIPRLSNYFSFVFSSLLAGSALLPRADYLMTESPPLFLGIAGYILSRLKGSRWIFNVSDLWPESAVRLGVIGDGLPLRLSEGLETFCYRNAWLVTGQSREILNGVGEKVPRAATYHFSNGVDSSLFTPALRSGTIHHELGDGAECVAVYAGLHGIAQGLDQILKAAELLSDLEGRLKIVFVGDGPEKESLLEKAKGSRILKFLPSRRKEEIPELLASADIAIVPLKGYLPGAVPSKIYEAMASGLPVVLAAEGEAVNILNDSRAGIAVSPGKTEDLAGALRLLALDGNRRRELGENGLRSVKERFDRRQIIKKFVELLKERQ